MWGHKRSLSKFKQAEIISTIFSDCNTMKLDQLQEKKLQKKKKKDTNVEVKQYATKQPMNHWINQRGNKYLETNDNNMTI